MVPWCQGHEELWSDPLRFQKSDDSLHSCFGEEHQFEIFVKSIQRIYSACWRMFTMSGSSWPHGENEFDDLTIVQTVVLSDGELRASDASGGRYSTLVDVKVLVGNAILSGHLTIFIRSWFIIALVKHSFISLLLRVERWGHGLFLRGWKASWQCSREWSIFHISGSLIMLTEGWLLRSFLSCDVE